MRLPYSMVAGLLWVSHAVAAPPNLQEREAALAAQLRCVVCQNQTVAESQAPIALDMRKAIATQLEQGHSDSEIVDFFEQRYGSFVRYSPPWRPSTWLLWCAPFALLLVGLCLLWHTLRQRTQRSQPQRLTEQERAQASAWLAHGAMGEKEPKGKDEEAQP